jgi:hypothetical protein
MEKIAEDNPMRQVSYDFSTLFRSNNQLKEVNPTFEDAVARCISFSDSRKLRSPLNGQAKE